MKTIKQILAECKGEEDFKPHMMYDPKTGKGYKANTYADHVKMDKMGYTHEKPEIKEAADPVAAAFFGSMFLTLLPFMYIAGDAMRDDLKKLKAKSAKKGFKPSKEDQSLLQKFIAMVKRKKPDAVSKAMKKANESVELEEGVSKTYKGNTIHQVGKHRSYDDMVAYKLSNADAKILNKFMKSASAKERTQMHNMFWKTDEKDTDDVTAAKGPKMAIAYAKKKINEASNPYAKIGGSPKNPEVRKNLKKSIADLKKKTHGKSKKEELDEAKSSSGYELYHRDFSGAMQHAYAHAKKKGFIVDKDDVDHKVAMGPKRPSSGKTNKYILDTNKKQKLHVQVANLDNKRYELNMYIESVQLDESVISDVKDIVAKKQAKKIQGVMVDMFTASAISQIYDKVNDVNKGKMDKMKVTQLANLAMKLMKKEEVEEGSAHDRLRAKLKKGGLDLDKRAKDRKAEHEKLKKQYGLKDSFDLAQFMESSRAKRDAMSAMGKRGVDPADVDDYKASDDDRKAASKNVLMQIRKASDLPKGGDIEFPDSKKKGKISQDDAKMIVKMFNTLKKPVDKTKFQKLISKDMSAIKTLLKRMGR